MIRMKSLTVLIFSANHWDSVAFVAPVSFQSLQHLTTFSLEYAKPQDAMQPASLASSHNELYPDTTNIERGREKSLSKSDIAWKERYEELKEFKQKHGHTNVSCSHTNKSLNRWVTNQRSLRKQGKKSMTPERICALDALGFSWEGRMTWKQRYRQLKEFYEKNGHSKVPINWEDNVELGRFVAAQRHQYKLREAGRKNTLTNERLKMLQSLNFVFDVSDLTTKAWTERYEELKSFFEENGHCNVTVKHQLWRWCDSQRIAYRQMAQGKKSSMTTEKIKKLNELNFIWNPRETHWIRRLDELKEFQIKHGHVNVSEDINPQLSSWLKKQRNSMNLDEEKRAALTALGLTLRKGEQDTVPNQETKISEALPQERVGDSGEKSKRRDGRNMKQIPIQYALLKSKYRRRVARARAASNTVEESAERLMYAYANRSLWGQHH